MDYQNYYDSLERMYPDTYRVVYPMVSSACDRITMPVNEDMLNRMTDDIYDRCQMACRVNDDCCNSRQFFNPSMSERPRRRNRIFRDLIRILLIRELLRRR